MSLQIIKAGVQDTIQDLGRFGYQHLGVNPTGVMDRFSSQVVNALLGKELGAPVLELHFPAARLQFGEATVICLGGADFSPRINDRPVPLHHPIAVPPGSTLAFEKVNYGARCYLSILQDIKLTPWMGSLSTNLKAAAGGAGGRALQKKDVLYFRREPRVEGLLRGKDLVVLPWKSQETVDTRMELQVLLGSEWHWMKEEAREAFTNSYFQITLEADRMGYKLAGAPLEVHTTEQLVSSPVNMGTIQLLPDGQLIVLMADHQTTGGYPRVGHVISAHLPILAQKKANDVLRFSVTDLETAEGKLVAQQKYLQQLQLACKFRMEEYLGPAL